MPAIRRAKNSDIPVMAGIIADNFDYAMPEHSPDVRKKFKEHCTEVRLHDDLRWKEVFVICVNRRVVGTGALVNFGSTENSRWSLSNFFIAPEFHGKGLGRQLLLYLLELAKNKHVHILHVPSSLTAVGFYQKFGFIKDDIQPEEDLAHEIVWHTLEIS